MLSIRQRIAKLFGARYVLVANKDRRYEVYKVWENGCGLFVKSGRYYVSLEDGKGFSVDEYGYASNFVSWEWVK